MGEAVSHHYDHCLHTNQLFIISIKTSWSLGRDDFYKIFRPTNFWVSVTKRNFSVYMGYFHNVSYTPQQYYPSDRIFWRKGKNGFSSFSCFLFGQMVPYAFKSSSVTKRNNMDCIELLWCASIYMQRWYIGDRKPPLDPMISFFNPAQ